MSNDDTNKTDVIDETEASEALVPVRTALPVLEGDTAIEEIPAGDLDEVAGGMNCTLTCGTTKVSFREIV